MRNLAIIPARGGSKRIPKKNMKDFLGKPILAYSIETALKSKLFDEVMVSTDNKEIAELSILYGAKVPFMRSKEKSGDFAILNDVFVEVLEDYKMQGDKFDNVCLLLPTAPLIRIQDINESYKILTDSGFDSVRPIVKFGYPIQRAFRIRSNSKVEMIEPKYYLSRSQDLEPTYHDAGQFYWVKKDKNLIDINKGAIVISELSVQDIDNKTDWKLAELKYKLLFY